MRSSHPYRDSVGAHLCGDDLTLVLGVALGSSGRYVTADSLSGTGITPIDVQAGRSRRLR